MIHVFLPMSLSSAIRCLMVLTLVGIASACRESDTQTSMSKVLGETTDSYSKVTPGKAFSFPNDHLAHNDFRQEWWYLTANLTTEKGEDIGVQWTQFRIALGTEKSESEWATNQLYMAHSAVTTKQHHLAQERWSRQHPELADVQPNPLVIKLDGWRWQSVGHNLFPATLTVQGKELGYKLSLSSQQPFHLQGDKGYSQKSVDGKVASYYYSQPFIDVSGTVVINGESQKVSGTAWLDREWSSQFLARTQQGWDWFALRLDDETALVIFQLRATAKSNPNFYSARLMRSDGSGRSIASSDITMSAQAFKTIDQSEYPVSWLIDIPSEKIKLSVNALNDDAKMPLSVSYWEGPIEFDGSHSGVGYMELTGY